MQSKFPKKAGEDNVALEDVRTCYCGSLIKPYGEGWRHVSSNSPWCYPEEADLDEESRCNAMPEPESPFPPAGE